MRILGVDCGDVIFRTWGGVVPGSLDALRKIAQSGRFEKIYIVSKVNPISRAVFLLRLRRLNFWKHAGIPRSNIYFCRSHEEKAPICEKLGVTDFVDDRLRVLHHLKTVPNLYALNPRKTRESKKFSGVLGRATVVRSWEELTSALLSAK